MGGSAECPCVTCQHGTDCPDDAYCADFEAWFMAQPTDGWEVREGVQGDVQGQRAGAGVRGED